jgi:predicted nucleic acid-binding protein
VSGYVIDASVAAKWFIPEAGSEAALAYLDDEHKLLAPDLLWPELGNVLWKKARRGELSADEARDVLDLARRAPLLTRPSGPLTPAALELALALDCTVYDGLYLALAVQSDSVLITADEALKRRVAGTDIDESIRVLGERRGNV